MRSIKTQLDLFLKAPPRDVQELREKFPNLGTAWRPKANPQKLIDRYHQLLIDREMDMGDRIGTELQQRGEHGKYKNTYGKHDSNAALRVSHIQGARGEIASAKCYDFAFPRDYMDRFARPDFGPLDGPGICVRTSGHKYPSIIVKPHDPDNSIALLVMEVVPGDYILHAWCWIAEAKAHTPLTNPPVRVYTGETVDVEKPAHFVRTNGNPIVHFLRSNNERNDEIPQAILDLCPKGFRVW